MIPSNKDLLGAKRILEHYGTIDREMKELKDENERLKKELEALRAEVVELRERDILKVSERYKKWGSERVRRIEQGHRKNVHSYILASTLE